MELKRRNFFYVAGTLVGAAALTGSLDGIRVFLKDPEEERPAVARDNVFKSGGKNLVAVVGGKDAAGMVREAVSLLGGLGKIGVRGKTVLVKPNVVAGRRNPTTTSPEIVRSVVRLLYEEGAAKVYVGDMSALTRLSTRSNMEKTGIKKAAEAAGAEPVYFEDHEWVKVRLPKAEYISAVDVTEWLFKVDRIVNLPVVKTHRSAQYSICLKNFVGATHFRQRPYFVDSSHWEEVIAEINLAWTPDLNIADGTKVMVEGGPWRGEEKETNLVIASGDRVAADVAGLGVIKSFGLWKGVAKRSVWDQRQIRRAVQIGLGAKSRDEVLVKSAALGEKKAFEELMKKVQANIV